MYSIVPEVTKSSLFSAISQEQVFQKYLGIPVKLGELVCSPLRKDKNPTCGFKYSRTGILYFRDFSGHFFGNCIDLVMFMYHVTYGKAIDMILSDFNPSAEPLVPSDDIPSYREPQFTSFEINWRSYDRSDMDYWSRMYINQQDLYWLKVAPPNNIWINGKLTYSYTRYNPAYAIVLAPGEYKVYFPLSPKPRFLCNTNCVMGWDQLPVSGSLVIITKSFKDILVLHKFNIPAVSWHSEALMPEEERIRELKSRFDHVYSLYDFDLTGVSTANKMKKVYGIHPLFFTNGRFGYHDCKAKDAAEYIEAHGIEGGKQLYDAFFKVMIDDESNPF